VLIINGVRVPRNKQRRSAFGWLLPKPFLLYVLPPPFNAPPGRVRIKTGRAGSLTSQRFLIIIGDAVTY